MPENWLHLWPLLVIIAEPFVLWAILFAIGRAFPKGRRRTTVKEWNWFYQAFFYLERWHLGWIMIPLVLMAFGAVMAIFVTALTYVDPAFFG